MIKNKTKTPKRPECKPNSLFLPFPSPCPISDLCFLVSIFSNRSIPLQLVPVIFKQREAYSFQVRDNQIEYYTALEVQAADNKSQSQYPDRCCLGLINLCSHCGVAIPQRGQHSPLAPSPMGFHLAGTGSEEQPF